MQYIIEEVLVPRHSYKVTKITVKENYIANTMNWNCLGDTSEEVVIFFNTLELAVDYLTNKQATYTTVLKQKMNQKAKSYINNFTN
jgi:hypothetical protein